MFLQKNEKTFVTFGLMKFCKSRQNKFRHTVKQRSSKQTSSAKKVSRTNFAGARKQYNLLARKEVLNSP